MGRYNHQPYIAMITFASSRLISPEPILLNSENVRSFISTSMQSAQRSKWAKESFRRSSCSTARSAISTLGSVPKATSLTWPFSNFTRRSRPFGHHSISVIVACRFQEVSRRSVAKRVPEHVKSGLIDPKSFGYSLFALNSGAANLRGSIGGDTELQKMSFQLVFSRNRHVLEARAIGAASDDADIPSQRTVAFCRNLEVVSRRCHVSGLHMTGFRRLRVASVVSVDFAKPVVLESSLKQLIYIDDFAFSNKDAFVEVVAEHYGGLTGPEQANLFQRDTRLLEGLELTHPAAVNTVRSDNTNARLQKKVGDHRGCSHKTYDALPLAQVSELTLKRRGYSSANAIELVEDERAFVCGQGLSKEHPAVKYTICNPKGLICSKPKALQQIDELHVFAESEASEVTVVGGIGNHAYLNIASVSMDSIESNFIFGCRHLRARVPRSDSAAVLRNSSRRCVRGLSC